MRMRFKRLMPLLIFSILCLTIGSPAVLAAENPSLELGVTVNLSGTLPAEPEDFLIKLTADEIGNPMPEGTLTDVYTLTVTGEGTATFPKITYPKVGIYKYRIWQQPGLDPNGYYDTTLYHLTVYVTNAVGGGMEITTVLYKDDETEKSPEVIFENRYADPAVVRFSARKLLDDTIPQDGRFTFLLTDADGTVLQTKQNIGDDVTFDAISIRETGITVFYLKEQRGTDLKMIYDPTVYKITVATAKTQTGDYVATTTIEKAGAVYPGIPLFNNRTGELPNTGESNSVLPFIGALLLLGGAALSLRSRELH